MSDQQILGYITASRESLDRTLAVLRDMRSRYPGGYGRSLYPGGYMRSLYPGGYGRALYPGGYCQLEADIATLVARQDELEQAAGVDLSGGRLGSVLLTVVAGGMALLGIGGWAWQQYEETAQAEANLKQTDAHIRCVNDLEAQGWDAGDASLICSGKYGGTAQNIATVLKYGIILVLGLGGIYLLTKVVK